MPDPSRTTRGLDPVPGGTPGDSAAADGPRCLDRNLLAGFAEGRLLAVEEAAVRKHLASCPACRAAADAVSASAGVAPEEAPAPRPILGLPAMAAAAAVLLVAAGAVALLRGSGREPPATEDADAALVAAAETLARARPDLFGDFRPYGPAERARRPGPLRAADLPPAHPRGTVLEVRPGFRWTAPPGAGAWRVRLLRQEDAAVLWESGPVEPPLSFPADRDPLEPGRAYYWEAVADGPLGPRKAGHAFAVASAAERARLEASIREIDARAPASRPGLLKAHLALRLGMPGEAEAHALRWLASRPGDAAGLEMLERIRSDPGSGRGE